MKKAGWTLVVIAEIAALVGAWLFTYFADKRMGMMRWVSHKERRWQEVLPADTVERILPVAAAVIMVAVTVFAWRKLRRCNRRMTPVVWTAVLNLLYLGVSLYLAVNDIPAGYFVSLFLLGAAGCQTLLLGITAAVCRVHRKNRI